VLYACKVFEINLKFPLRLNQTNSDSLAKKFKMTDLKIANRAFDLLKNADFMLSLNDKLFDTMNCLLMIQKQTIDGLNSANSKKTERLLSKVQSDPGVAKRLYLLNEMQKDSAKAQSHTPSVTSKAKRSLESLNIDLCNEEADDQLIKKMKLNDESLEKESTTNENPLSDTNASLTSSGKKFFEEDPLDHHAATTGLEIKKHGSNTIFSPGRGAFTSFKLNKQNG